MSIGSVTRAYYSSLRPTSPARSLPARIESCLGGVTPRSIERHIVSSLDIRRNGEKYDLHPAIIMLGSFGHWNRSILSGSNRVVFDSLLFDWERGVLSSTQLPQSITMCQPTHFFDGKIPYSINIWMRKGFPVSRALAVSQWNDLKAEIARTTQVDVMGPVRGCPDMVFVDQGLAVPSMSGGKPIFIPSAMKETSRKQEVSHAARFFQSRGYEVVSLRDFLPRNAIVTFESNGDVHVVPGKNVLFVGFGGRTSSDVLPAISEITGHTVVPIFMDQKTGAYHLDTATSIISPNSAVVFAPGLGEDSLALFLMFFRNIYFASQTEADEEFICNSKQIGDRFFTQTSVSEQFLRFLGSRPAEEIAAVLQFDMSEFNKSGGGINCCSKLTFHTPPEGQN